MRLASVLLARYYGLVQIEDLNLNGTVYYPEVTAKLVERYGFMKYPTGADAFDETKGIEFNAGRAGKQVIDKLMILSSGVYLDTPIDTTTSEALWFEMMEWAVNEFGVTFSPEMVTRCAYVSNVTFHSDAPILAVNPIMSEIGKVVAAQVESSFKLSLDYEPAAVSITFDQLATKLGPAAFTVQRREGVPFGENKYFSTAPLKTEIHLDLLERWERAVKV
jgi:hypothetical protein